MTSPITSHRNERVKAIKRLVLDAGERRRLGLTVVEGVRVATDHLRGGGAVEEALVSSRLTELAGGTPLLELVTQRLADRPERLLRVTDEVLASVSDTHASQGLILVVPRPAREALPAAQDRPVLVAWELQDPGNAGSLVRTAEAAGCSAMIFAASPAGPLVDAFSPRAVRAAASSSLRLPVHEWRGEPERLIADLRAAGFRVASCVAHADGTAPPDRLDLRGAVALLIGAETRGLPAVLAEAADLAVTIPLEVGAESLNAAAAAAVIAFEAARQRRAGG
jgi:TrmH family RNA methyltransferase